MTVAVLFANSRLVAGIGDDYSAGIPVYVLMLIAIDAVIVAYVVCGILLNVEAKASKEIISICSGL